MDEVTYSSPNVALSVLPGVGARMHRLRAFGHDLLRTPDDPLRHADDTFFWGAYVMAPWCGRIDTRPTAVAGATVTVPANFPDGTAIHGQVYARPWHSDGDGWYSITAGGDGWPWPYAVGIRYGVDGFSVLIEQSVTNLGDGPMPAGVGLHPWFRRPVEVTINGDEVFDSNSDSSALPLPVGGPWDRRAGGLMPNGLDATWTGLREPLVHLRWPEIGVHAQIRTHGSDAYVVAASPPELDAVAVEPQTHAPQGLRRLLNGEPGALTLLDPGGALTLNTQISFHRIQESQS